ncbi:MAG: DUF2135 domain-containing protein, partial [Spirochaetota bacterium]
MIRYNGYMARGSLSLAVTIMVLFSVSRLFAATAVIESPRGGFTTQWVQEIKGSVAGANVNRATLVINGIPQTIPLTNGRFSINAVVCP